MSASARTFSATIAVNDRTAAPLAAIAARLRAISSMNGLQRMAASAQLVRRQFGGMAASVAGVAGSLSRMAGIGGGGVIGGLLVIANNAASSAASLAQLTSRLGVSTAQLQAFQYAAIQSGASGEAFAGAVGTMNQNLRAAGLGQNANLVALLRRLDIPLRDVNRQVRTATDLMPALALAFQRNQNPATQAAMAITLGGESMRDLIPLLARGPGELARLTEAFRRYGHTFSPSEVAALREYTNTTRDFRLALTGIANAIGARVAPLLTPLIRQFADWIAANRELISTRVGEWVTTLADALRNFDVTKLVADLQGFLTTARELYDRIGGWRTVAIAAGAYFAGPLILSISLLAAAITTTLIPPLLRATGLLAGLAAARLPALAGASAAAAPALAAAAAPTAAAVGGGVGRAAAAAAGGALGLGAMGVAGGAAVIWSQVNPMGEERARRLGLPNLAGPQDGFDAMGRPIGGSAAPVPALQPLYGPARPPAPAPAPPPQGEVRVRVDFQNVPPGARVEASGGGTGVRAPEVDVGYARLGAGE